MKQKRRKARRTVSPSLPSLKSRRVSDRLRALDVAAGSGDPNSIQDFLTALGDTSPTVRWVAADYLGREGMRKAASRLMKALADPNNEVRMVAARSIGTLLRGQASPAVLVARLKDADELVRVEVCEALATIGDRQAMPALRKALGDSSPLVRSYAAIAIGELGVDDDLPALEARLRKENCDAAKVGLYGGLYRLGKRDALVRLSGLLQSREYRVRCAAANALADVITDQDSATIILPELRKVLRRESTVAGQEAIKNSIAVLRRLVVRR